MQKCSSMSYWGYTAIQRQWDLLLWHRNRLAKKDKSYATEEGERKAGLTSFHQSVPNYKSESGFR